MYFQYFSGQKRRAIIALPSPWAALSFSRSASTAAATASLDGGQSWPGSVKNHGDHCISGRQFPG